MPTIAPKMVMQANTNQSLAIGNNLRNVGRSVRSYSVVRKMQRVFRFRRSSSFPAKYAEMDKAEASQAHMNQLETDFLMSLSGAFKSASSSSAEQPMLAMNLNRSELQWHETVPQQFLGQFQAEFGVQEVKRQVAVHELFTGEMNLCYDINLIIHVFQRPIKELGKLTELELQRMFPNMDKLYRLHAMLAQQLMAIRDVNGVYGKCPGQIVFWWVAEMGDVYYQYCFDLKNSAPKLIKKLMDDKEFGEFVESNFVQANNRKLDLKTFIDLPRSHLMKYSLMLKAIGKQTTDADELHLLELAEQAIKTVISDIDDKLAKYDTDRRIEETFFADPEVARLLQECTKIDVEHRVRRRGRGLNRRKSTLILFDRALALLHPMSKASVHKYKCIASIKANSQIYFDYGKSTKYGSAVNINIGLLGKTHFRKRAKPKLSSAAQSTALSRKLRSFKSMKNKNSNNNNEAAADTVSLDSGSSVGSTVSRRGSLLTGPLRPPRTVRIYSLLVKFDITVKFRDSDDLATFINKLQHNFEISRRTGSLTSNKKTKKGSNRSKVTKAKVGSFVLKEHGA